MKICVVGVGYVGLVTGTCFADMGNEVFCVDVDHIKIEHLKQNKIPIFEPGLEEMVRKNQQEGRLNFTTDLSMAVKASSSIFIAVGTPPNESGAADLKYVFQVASDIGKCINEYKVIVDKSTVPVGTGDKVKQIIASEILKRNADVEFDIVSNPEFLKEGAAIADFQKPDRIVVGSESPKAIEYMKQLYSPFTRNNHPVLIMDVRSAEMTKYAANAALACRISFMNEIANICEKAGANIDNIRLGIGTDSRIGMDFLYAGIGYGGSCFPKDVQALQRTAQDYGINAEILEAIENVNNRQKRVLVDKIVKHFNGQLSNKIIAVWGLAFKPNTDDMREAPALTIIDELLRKGATIQAFDPVAIDEAKKVFGENPSILYSNNQYEVLKDADAVVLVTEWRNFRQPNFERMRSLMKQLLIFDGRNQYNPDEMQKLNVQYYSIGRKWREEN